MITDACRATSHHSISLDTRTHRIAQLQTLSHNRCRRRLRAEFDHASRQNAERVYQALTFQVVPVSEENPVCKTLARKLVLLAAALASTNVCAAQVSQQPDTRNNNPAAPPSSATAEYDPKAWKEFSPPDGGFSILFPGEPQSSTQVLSRDGSASLELHVHRLKSLAEYSVIYSNYPIREGDPADARAFLDRGVKGGVAAVNSELLSVTEIALDNYPGRLLKERTSDGEILRVKLLLVGRRLYQITVTTPSEEGVSAEVARFYEEIANRFLDSFKLALTAPAKGGEVDRYLALHPGEVLRVPSAPLGAKDNNFLPGRLTGGKTISRSAPFYPPAARSERASGVVLVLIVVDEGGKVVAAQALGGPVLLQGSALQAARTMRFEPTLLDGKPVKVSGTVTFTFSLQ
ncbi:MAG: energy transducer TonB [Pyrinomonadaceae bacterium]